MTPRTLFNIILKVLGLFFIRNLLIYFDEFLGVVLYFLNSDKSEGILTLISATVTLAVEFFICYFLIFKSDWLITKLKLLRGLDQDVIPLNIDRSAILSISVIIIAALILINEIPNFCRLAFSYVQLSRVNYSGNAKNIPYIVESTVKILLGVLLLVESRKVVGFILSKGEEK